MRLAPPALFAPIAVLSMSARPAVAQVPAFDVAGLPELAGATSGAGKDGLVAISSGGGSSWIASGRSADSSGVQVAVAWSIPAGVPPEPVLPLASLDPATDSWANGAAHDPATSTTHVFGASTSSQRVLTPVMWSRAANDSAFGSAVPLPVLPGGTGEAIAGHPTPCFLVGWSADLGGVDKAAAWTEDPNGLVVEPLPDLGAGLPARASAALVTSHPTPCYLAGGWATNAAGDTIPQAWDRITGGSWNRTSLPLLPGGAEGWVQDLVADSAGVAIVLAGRASTATGSHHAARWESGDGGQTWSVTDLGAAAGMTDSSVESVVPELSGIVVLCGHSHDGTGNETATLWLDANGNVTVHDLNDLVPGGSSLRLGSAMAVGKDEDGGLIVFGNGTHGAAGSGHVGSHAYLARQIGGTGAPVAGIAEAVGIAAVPNPFSRTTGIAFTLPARSAFRLTVHDVAGRRVALLAEGERAAGIHRTSWHGRDGNGSAVAPGVYLVRLEAAGTTAVEKVVRLR